MDQGSFLHMVILVRVILLMDRANLVILCKSSQHNLYDRKAHIRAKQQKSVLQPRASNHSIN